MFNSRSMKLFEDVSKLFTVATTSQTIYSGGQKCSYSEEIIKYYLVLNLHLNKVLNMQCKLHPYIFISLN